MSTATTRDNVLVSVHEKLIAEGIKALLDRHFDFNTFVTVLDDKDEIITFCREHDINLLILDMDHPLIENFTLIHDLTSDSSDVGVIAITNRNKYRFLQKIVKTGVHGLILKSSGMEMLKKAIQHVVKREHYFCDEATLCMVQEEENEEEHQNLEQGEDLLTDREVEILELICQELTNPQIAEKLQISVRTVDAHRRNLLQKTGAKNTVGLVKYAVKHRLLKI